MNVPHPITNTEAAILEEADCCRNLWTAVIHRARKDADGVKIHTWDDSTEADDAVRFLDEIGAVR